MARGGYKSYRRGGGRRFTARPADEGVGLNSDSDSNSNTSSGESSSDSEAQTRNVIPPEQMKNIIQIGCSSNFSEESDAEEFEVQNPNRKKKEFVKLTDLDNVKTKLSRKEREELQKQQAKARYEKLHREGKTDEAKADLKRLEEIRKKREAAQKERDEKLKSSIAS